MYAENRFTPDLAQQHYIEGLLSRLEWSAATPRVLAIGRGAIDVADHYVEAYTFSRLQIDRIDLDDSVQRYPTAMSTAADSRLAASKLAQVTERQPYHLIWTEDLFDALDPSQGQHLLRQLLRAVAPSGELVIGSHLSPHRFRAIAATGSIPAITMTLRRGQMARNSFYISRRNAHPSR